MSPTPYEQIYRKYRDTLPDVDFAKLVGHHLQFGFCFGTPSYFIMGRPVDRKAHPSLIRDPYQLFSKVSADSWYVHAFAGDIAKVWDIMPWPLGWIGFDRFRDGGLELTFARTEDLRRLSSNAPTRETLAPVGV